MKILLINPPAEMLKQEGIGMAPPLGLLYVGAVLEKSGHEIKIIDCVTQNWKRPKKFQKNGEIIYLLDVEDCYLENFIKKFKPEVVGIANIFATSEKYCLEIAKKIKDYDKEIKVVIGGTNASARAEHLLGGDVDFVIKGEGEYAMRDLVSCLENKKNYEHIAGLCFKKATKHFVSQSFNWVENLDELPFPAYHLLETGMDAYFQGNFPSFLVHKKMLTAVSSRGCVRNCVFCSGMKHLGMWRARDPKNVIKELIFLKEQFGIKEVAFVDPNIGLDRNRFIKLLELMEKSELNLYWTPNGGIYIQTFTPDLIKLMRKTGCHTVYLAIEHGDPEMQKYIGKIVPLEKVKDIVKECKKYGIWTHGNFVLGLPGETPESLEKCFDYAKQAKFDSIAFFIGTPLPGSRLYDEISQKKDLQSENLRFLSKNIWWTEMDPEFLLVTVKKFMIAYAKFKMLDDLKPVNLFLKVKNFRLFHLKIYLKTVKRFWINLIFR